jgi:hypothetical protein
MVAIALIGLVAIGFSTTARHSSPRAPVKIVIAQRSAGVPQRNARKRRRRSTSTSTSSAASAATSVPASGICKDSAVTKDDISVSAHTGCPFARAVVTAYEEHPSATVDAYSSVTQLEYTLRCVAANGTVACKTETGDGIVAFAP